MIVISPKLLADFQQIIRKDYIEKKLDGYAELDPSAYDLIGENNYRRYIESAVKKTESYGLDSETAIDSVLALMDHLGHEFETDPLFDWAWLNKSAEASEGVRQRLEKANATLGELVEESIGQNREVLEAALKRFIEADIRELTGITDDQAIIQAFRVLYPERMEFAHIVNLTPSFLPLAKEKARQMALSTPVGIFLTAYTMFMLGSSFDSDPRYEGQFGLDVLSFNSEIVFMNALKRYFRELLENNKAV